MKPGKKLLFVFLTLFFAFLIPFSSFSAAGSTEVEELELELTPIRGWMEFTRGMPENDPVFTTYPEIDKRIMDSVFLRDDIYYNAVYAEDGSKEILITMVESGDLFDWNDLSDDAYRAYAEQILSGNAAEAAGISGASFTEYRMVDHPQCRWMKLYGEISNESDQVKLIEYATIVNGRHYNVMLRSSNSMIIPSEEIQFDAFLQSVRFSEIKPAPFSMRAFVQSRYFLLYAIAAGVLAAGIIALFIVLAVRRGKRKALRSSEEPEYVGVEEQKTPLIEELPPFDSESGSLSGETAGEEEKAGPEKGREEATAAERPSPGPVLSPSFSGLSSLIEELPPFEEEPSGKDGRSE